MAVPMVGRDDELGAVMSARRNGAAGVLISGPPGIGRTAMATAVAEQFTDAGADVVVLRVTASSQHVPFGALAPLLGREGATDGPITATAVDAALRSRAGRRELVIVVDDAHLLDHHAATALADAVRDRAAFVAATALDDRLTGPLLRHPDLAVVSIPQLDLEGVALVLTAHGADVADTEHWLERSGGNPTAIVRMLDLARSPDQARRTDVLDTILGAASATTLRALDVLAVAEPLPVAALGEIQPGADAATVLAGLEATRLVQLVEDLPGGTHVRFLHSADSITLLDRLAPLKLRSVVRTAVRAIRAAGVPRDAGALVRLAALSVQVGVDVPLPELRLAAAGARDGDDAAVALRLARAAALASSAFDDLRRWVDLAYEHHDDAGLDEGLVELEHWRRAGDRSEEERTEAGVVIGLVTAERAFWRRADANGALEALERAAVGARRDEVRAVTARILAATGRFDEAIAIAEPSSHSADARTRAQSAAALAHALRRCGRPTDAVARIDEVLALPEADDTVLVVSRRVLGAVRVLALLEAGRWDDAEAEADRTRAMAERLDDTPGLAVATLVLGAVRCERGRTTEAGAIAHRALALFQQLGQPAGVRWAWSVIGLAAGLGGDAASARTAAERLAALPAHPAALFSGIEARALAWSETGHPDVVRERLAASARGLAERGDLSAAVQCLHDLASVGAPDLARSLLDELQLDIVDEALATSVSHVTAIASTDFDALDGLVARFRALGGDRWAAESTALAAGWAARAGDARAAKRLAAEVEELAARCPGLATPPLVVARVVDAGAVPLTPRERDVATLAAHGLTSRAIAERLGLSVRTVDNHLSNCFDKLHVRSRNELGEVLGIG